MIRDLKYRSRCYQDSQPLYQTFFYIEYLIKYKVPYSDGVLMGCDTV
jgi:hypothetical protein